MAIADIVEVSESDFEFQVLEYSETLPVIVDFWAEWSSTSKTLTPILEKLTREAGGTFRLAKVNVDENSNLAIRFGVRSVPTIKAFQNRTIVAEFSGARTANQIKDFLATIEAHPTDLIFRKAESLIAQHNWLEAKEAFLEVLSSRPNYPPALLGLAKTLLALGDGYQAKQILTKFPASREFSTAEKLLPLANSILDSEQGQTASENIQDAIFKRSIKLFVNGKYAPAMDGLLDILRENKTYRNGLAKEILIAIFIILGNEDPLTIKYRKELATIIF